MERVRFTSGEAVVVRVVAVANIVVLLMAFALVSTLFIRAGDEYASAKSAAAAERLIAADIACNKPAPTSGVGYGKLWDSLDKSRWSSGRAVAKVPMPDGRTVWLYGQTTARRGKKEVLSAYSTAITQRGGCLHVSGLGTDVFPAEDAGGIVYSIISGIAAGPDSILVTALRLKLSDSCQGCFTQTGTRAALLGLDSRGDLKLREWINLPENDTAWGAALASDGKTVAVFGTQLDTSLIHFRFRVATVPLASFADLRKWKFSSAVIAEGIDDTLTAWHNAAGWHVATVPDPGSHTNARLWNSGTAGGTYRGAAAPSADAQPDRRFSVGPVANV